MIDIITADAVKLFVLDEVELFNLKVDVGLAYLRKRFETQPHVADALKDHPKFWLWWRELWAERDRKLLSTCEHREFFVAYLHPTGKVMTLPGGDSYQPKGYTYIPVSDVWEFYTKYNKPERIQFYPNDVLINECLASRTEFITI